MFVTEADVFEGGEIDVVGGLAADRDPVLLELGDLVAADRSACAVVIEDGIAVLHAAERSSVLTVWVITDVMDLLLVTLTFAPSTTMP